MSGRLSKSETKKVADCIANVALQRAVDDPNQIYFAAAAVAFTAIVNSRRYLRKRKPLPKSRIWYEKVLLKMDDNRFISLMRMQRDSFNRLLILIQDHPIFNSGHSSKQLPIGLQLAITLFRLGSSGNGASIKKIATNFGVGDGGTIGKCTERVVTALLHLQDQFIQWPDHDERKQLVEATKHEFPDCIGYLDGTEINLAKAPLVDKESYYSRRGRYSIKAQAVCDHRKRIRYSIVGHPGSAHDARQFATSQMALNPSNFFDESQYVLADSAYILTETCIVPYKSNNNNMAEGDRKAFNNLMKPFRVRIEHCFGMLKEKFQSLKSYPLPTGTEDLNKKFVDWFAVCCILHNFLISINGHDEIDMEYANNDETEESTDEEQVTGPRISAAERKRQRIYRTIQSNTIE